MRSRAALAVFAVLIIAACGNGSSSNKVGAGAELPSPGAATSVISLDDGHWSTLRLQLVPASSGGGVWLWSQSADDSRVWHYDPAVGKAVSWSLGSDPALRGGAALPQLVACPSAVWFGVDQTLVRLDPTSGTVASVSVPKAPSVAAVDAHRPPELKGLEGVDALACDGNDLVVGLADAAQAFRYNSTGSFDPIALPDGTEVASIARNDAGDLALGLQDYVAGSPHEVLVISGTQTRTIEVADSTHVVAAAGSSFLSGVRAQSIARGASTAGAARQSLLAPDVNPTLGLRPLPDGRVVVATTTGLRIVDPTNGKIQDLSLGTVTCMNQPTGPAASPTPGSAPPVSSSASPAAPLCAVTPRAFTVDPAGNIFAITSHALTVVQVAH